ncbi:MAG: hypothetical protein A2252_08685 [Elusimicrobia bacterium RIFOXYA2_FULL_39_19]|nr:MAG: hypothetical protein A2252_08685 [Elusimicrobia bacterium RIFOXYA2_FULL_39_19]
MINQEKIKETINMVQIIEKLFADLKTKPSKKDKSIGYISEIEEFIDILNIIKLILLDYNSPENSISFKGKIINQSKINIVRLFNLQDLFCSTLSKLDTKCLEEGNLPVFCRNIRQITKKWKPIDKFNKEFTMHFLCNAHIDLAWLWRKAESVEICRGTFNSVLNLMKEYPGFTYTQSQALVYEWMEEKYPKIFNGIKRAVKKGSWEIIGNMWVEPDCNIPDTESMARQFFYGNKYFREKFGIKSKIGWIVDSFGYNWNLPQFFKQCGIENFITQKISWNDTNEFPYHIFWWEAPDGSKVLTYFPFTSYVLDIATQKDLYKAVGVLPKFEKNTGLKDILVLAGVGDHGGGPTKEMLDKIEILKKMPFFPKVKYITANKYFELLRNSTNLKSLPVWKDELYLEYHRGALTGLYNLWGSIGIVVERCSISRMQKYLRIRTQNNVISVIARSF